MVTALGDSAAARRRATRGWSTLVRGIAAERRIIRGPWFFHASTREFVGADPTLHTVIIADVDDPQWEYVTPWCRGDVLDLTLPSMWTDIPERRQFDKTGVIEALPPRPRHLDGDDKAWFFASPTKSASPRQKSSRRSWRSGGRLRPMKRSASGLPTLAPETSCPTTGLTILATSISTAVG